MARLSEQLQREAEDARRGLEGDLAELRLRMTPGQIADELGNYARQTAAADFARNLMRDIRENPLPLLLIGVGVGWAVIASLSRQQTDRALVQARAKPLDVWQPPAPAPRAWEVAPAEELAE